MRNLIEEAAERLYELQKAGRSDAWTDDVGEADALAGRIGSSVLPLAPHFAPPLQRPPRRVEIDLHALAERGMLTPNAAWPRLASEYRILKRPLIRHAFGQGRAATPRGQFIMVTSAEGGEGRSFTAVNLAMSIAMEMNRSVLLVDADVPKPTLSSLLGLPDGPGLLDVLAGTADSADAICQTQLEGLSVLSCGHPDARATELLASEVMRAWLDELAAGHPDLLLIFDAPPLLTTTEGRELAAHIGQLILVVEADRTAHTQIRQALSIVENVPERMLLLNGARQRAGTDYDIGLCYGSEPPAADDARE